MKKLWGGRFTRTTAGLVEKFTHSFNVDRRLARYDLLGSIAHAQMLGTRKIIPAADAKRLVRTLQKMLQEFEQGSLKLDPAAEDVHTAIQQVLERRADTSAQRLHTARSRNDQVVTSLRLLCKEKLLDLQEETRKLQQQILRQAESAGKLTMPGFTHLRHAQPMLAAHLLLSYLEPLERDRQRLADALKRTDEMPLGSGALTGTGLPTDRLVLAKQLGFSRISNNSIDAVTDRDFVAEILFAVSLLGVHLSRIAEELIIFSTEEFGFLHFDERMLTGSSMMPQKQNPDFLELIRANAARLIGNLSAILTLLKGLPSGYQRDLQLDKEILFEGLDKIEQMLAVLTLGFQRIRWNKEKLAAQMKDDALYATDLAEYLVAKGVPFAQAHRSVGQLLAEADRRKSSVRSLPLATFQRCDAAFKADVYRLFDPAVSVARKRSAGSTNPTLVSQTIRRWKKIVL